MAGEPIKPPKAPSIRFRVEPGDVPPEKAARRLHLTLADFTRLLPALSRLLSGRPSNERSYPDSSRNAHDRDR